MAEAEVTFPGSHFASLIHTVTSHAKGCEGLLFGSVREETKEIVTDVEGVQLHKVEASILGFHCGASLTEPNGTLKVKHIKQLGMQYKQQVVGLFIYRPSAPLHPSLRDAEMYHSLKMAGKDDDNFPLERPLMLLIGVTLLHGGATIQYTSQMLQALSTPGANGSGTGFGTVGIALPNLVARHGSNKYEQVSPLLKVPLQLPADTGYAGIFKKLEAQCKQLPQKADQQSKETERICDELLRQQEALAYKLKDKFQTYFSLYDKISRYKAAIIKASQQNKR